jgi:hypothetical protein
VISVPDIDLERRAAKLESLVAKDETEFLHFRPLIETIERDVRLYLEVPFPRTVTDELRKIITLFVEFIAGDLAEGPGAVRRPLTVPTKLKELQRTGESILVDLGPYAELADHYFNEQVKRARLGRGSDSVSKEIDAISEKAILLRERIVDYLNKLDRAIRETSAPDDD